LILILRYNHPIHFLFLPAVYRSLLQQTYSFVQTVVMKAQNGLVNVHHAVPGIRLLKK